MKALLICRAISGSGKSTIANLIAKGYGENAKVFSTDNFFMKDGKYVFDVNMLHRYHQQNIENVRTAMENGLEVIILDNTNIKSSDTKPYISFAKQYGYTITFIEIDCGINAAKQRNNTRSPDRKIPDNVIDNQFKGFKNRFDVDALVK